MKEKERKKMGLGLPTGGGGDFVTYLKYNAKAGRWYTKDDDGNEYEVEKPRMIMDFANIKTGAFKFQAGVAPEMNFDTSTGSGDAVMPDDKFKRGFVVHVFSPKIGGLRELSATSGTMNEVINELYDQFDSAPEKAQGKVPVVACTGVMPIEGKHGTNYKPVMTLEKWTDRPAELKNGVAESKPAPAAAVPPPAEPVPAPAAAPTPAEDDPF